MDRAAATGSRKTRRLILAVLFAVLIFISKTLLPTPLDKMLVVVQALFLGLGAITLAPFGATLVATIAGLLTSTWRGPFAPFTLGFAVLYGLLVDGLLFAFKVRDGSANVRMKRLTFAVAVATTLTGMTSYYTTVYILPLLPRNVALETMILIAGGLNGVVGGYLAGVLWSKTLRHLI